ncbi:tRNA (N6-threonylcarbamoyladenosine(37)-N6)-methyltransferase TrmO [Candidatus Protochlamydia phocaeensis]|uniref:tRNA (N6-threonylcarbamoyladenosine(37)-N6)-methyltransferase TrmO n=1 Tax=Candidatus Protochlamydia phocaeensis TaxID=1414722 RepID=UPI00083851BF|nr:tRNA (N6-threonylcarbamoyladenosine(37)-N6)-methyltransferase TrmO [Candidatus Protochlamydia phocaeensis]
MMFTVDPIGYFYASQTKKYTVPRQPGLVKGNEGLIRLNPHCQFEQALEGLEGFDRIWVLFRFHLHSHWKPKVLPPRGKKKKGVFATRSPHRPNMIGLSCVELKAIEGLDLIIVNHDLINGTPILDIKPYLNYADSFQCIRQGWVDELDSQESFVIEWSPLALQQIAYLDEQGLHQLKAEIEMRLETNPFPYPNNRVKQLETGLYQLAYQTWRLYYTICGQEILIHRLASGYDEATLAGRKESKWPDVPIHQAFCRHFPLNNAP